jgi:hypothetical protein
VPPDPGATVFEVAADDMADKLREAAGSSKGSRRQDPKTIIRDLAEHSPSEATRLSAARALVEMNAEERARREADQGASSPLSELSDVALHELVDSNLAGDLAALLSEKSTIYPRDQYPKAHAVIDTTLARRVEGKIDAEVRARLAALQDPAEFERRVQAAAEELAEQLAEARVAAMRAELADASAAAEPEPFRERREKAPPVLEAENVAPAPAAKEKGLTWPEEPQRPGVLGTG